MSKLSLALSDKDLCITTVGARQLSVSLENVSAQ